MRRAVVALGLTVVAGSGVGAGLGACSSSSGSPASGNDASTTSDVSAGDAGQGNFLPEIACTDTIASIYADPGDVTAKPIGAILKCAKDQDLSAAQLTAAVDVTTDAGDIAYSGKPFTSGAHVYRVLYRTTRGNGQPGYSSALVFLPDTPRNGMGTRLPVIASAHGSRGQAGKCAPSLNDPAAADVEEDFQHQVYPEVGQGFAVIAPDLAGYANWGGAGNPLPAYSNALDVGQSLLDGARALRNVIPSSVTEQVVITGHSQGGDTALDALAISDKYGAGGVISAVAVYAPLWFSQRGYGAIFADPTDESLTANPPAIPITLWWSYTTSYLLDGPDAALELFDPGHYAAVQSFVDNDCWGRDYPQLDDAGSTANEYFTQTYQMAIEGAAVPILENGNCYGNQLCETWLGRMTADYPHLTGGAAKVPILVYYANNDTTLSPPFAQCAFNRLVTDQANVQICYDTDPVGHGGVVAVNSTNVIDWIASKTLRDGGAAQLTHCSALAPNDAGAPQLLGPDGGPIPCFYLLSTQ
jgi:predicted esterase